MSQCPQTRTKLKTRITPVKKIFKLKKKLHYPPLYCYFRIGKFHKKQKSGKKSGQKMTQVQSHKSRSKLKTMQKNAPS